MSMEQQRGYTENGNGHNHDCSYLIRIRGLPWSTTKHDILQFFDGVHIVNGQDGIHLITLSLLPNRPLGEAYIQLATQEDLELAHTFHRKTLGSRYIEVFDAHVEDFQNIISKQQHVDEERVLRLRGLPWDATKLDIAHFFKGLELNAETDIHMHYDRDGRASGEAYIQFRSIEDCQQALKRNMEKLGHRYVEIFTSTAQQLRRSIMQTNQVQCSTRMRPYDRNNKNNGNNSDNAATFGPTRDKRNNRVNMRKPNGNEDFGSRNRVDVRANGLFGGFNNAGGNKFNDRSSNIVHSRDFRNQQGYENIGIRNNNKNNINECSDGPVARDLFNGNDLNNFQNNFRQNDQSMGFNRDFGNGNHFGNHESNGPNFSGIVTGGNSTEHLVIARGIPFYCDEMDVCNFFTPIKPTFCNVILSETGRHTGKAEVYFNSREDLVHALQKQREKMGSRYIELFDASESRFRRF